MRIYLIHLINKFNLGGSTTYLIHLCEQMKQLGYEPVVIKRGKKERVGSYYHIPVYYYSDDKILHIAKHYKSIITYCFWSENGDIAKKLITLNVPIVLHDPSEFNDEWLSLAKNKSNTIVIREKNKYNLLEYGIQSTFIPHPYIKKDITNKKDKLAVCPARVDFRKHTDIVCEYNNLAANPVHIYGEINRMFDHHKLTALYPNWKNNYYGIIPAIFNEQIKIISSYQYSIDLTAIKKDGGGTQYCFFEAWNSNCILILNKKWDCENSLLVNNKNCIFINDAKELKYVLDNKLSYDLSEAAKILDNHTADIVIPQYINIIG